MKNEPTFKTVSEWLKFGAFETGFILLGRPKRKGNSCFYYMEDNRELRVPKNILKEIKNDFYINDVKSEEYYLISKEDYFRIFG